MATLDARADVLERAAGFHARAHGAGGDAEPLEVVAGEDHLDRGRECEQRRPREFVLRAGNAGEARAQILHREFFAFLVDGRAQLHVEVAGVLARVDRIGIEAIARAGHRIGAVESRQVARRPVDDLHLRVGRLERRARGQAHLHGELALGKLRNQFGAETRQDQRRDREQCRTP